ncbi:lipid droplet-associated hydrolase isoform X4 [Syngnathoides biaculeatus]|uniref:lipid droplet-associated hydrolase isoform X4 n=2 Tax=Syngnathoides biaculeatus TaxID=300417 RepID=UPI002ADD8630|nr:lipid droplet-associated hydrolase isoform X4 [Syngnathoides biaculeatus]
MKLYTHLPVIWNRRSSRPLHPCNPFFTTNRVSCKLMKDATSAADLDTFGLNGQVQHKLAFLRKHVPKETNLILVGHSIGCYIILEIMRKDPSLKILKAIMLFPTIERMALTPQGKVITPLLCHMRYLTYLSIFLLSLLPDRLKARLVKLVFAGIGALDHSVVQPTVGLLSGDSAANAVYMANQEMRTVLARDNMTIKRNLEKFIFYYGATDHWCPVQFYNEIKKDFPTGDFRLCENGFRHAFVLDAGTRASAGIPRFPFLQALLPALPEGSQGIARPAEMHILSSMFWVGVSLQWDVPGTHHQGGVPGDIRIRCPQPPQLLPLNAGEQQLHTEPLPDDQACRPISEGESGHPAEETQFGYFYPGSCSFGHNA